MEPFWIMIIAVVVFALGALAFALYAWKLYKDFPKVIKAKVMREEKLEFTDPTSETTKVRYRYHFKGRDNGNKMMTDVITYKEKKFKVGEKVSVHKGVKGTCHSNVPLWPIATSIICILLSVTSIFVYASATSPSVSEGDQIVLDQETGYYILTDTDALFYGDNMGLVILEDDTSYISTGDYGLVLYQDSLHNHDNSGLLTLHSLASNVSTDGAYDTLPANIVEEVEALGYVINTVATDSVELMEADGLITEEDAHDHEHVVEEDMDSSTLSTNPEETAPGTAYSDAVDTSGEETASNEEEIVTDANADEVVEMTTEPATTTDETNTD